MEIVMTRELEDSVQRIWTKLDEISEDNAKLDKRLTIHEERAVRMEDNVRDIKQTGLDNQTSLNKLEVKMAYAAGGFAVAVIIAQMVIQGLFR